MKFAFIQAEKAYFKVATMCRVFGVSRQGYYAYLKRGPSPRSLDDLELRNRPVNGVLTRAA